MRSALLCASILAAACVSGPRGPEAIALGRDACGHCQMVIVSRATAAQITAPGEEPRFFDDIGCMRDYLSAGGTPADLTVHVADHWTGAWVDARQAVFTRTSVSTPMSSGLVAHADTTSRDADPDARPGEPVPPDEVLRPAMRKATP